MEALQGEAAHIAAYLREIGLSVRPAELDHATFLPGVTLENDGLVVDPGKLLYPGDLLHEAGHLAVMTPERRASCNGDVGSDMGDEIAAQCWSYAAALHLGLSPQLVFHDHGYKGQAGTLIAHYRDSHVGVPLLQWIGLTLDRQQAAKAGQQPYPHMVRWLRGPSED